MPTCKCGNDRCEYQEDDLHLCCICTLDENKVPIDQTSEDDLCESCFNVIMGFPEEEGYDDAPDYV